MAVSGANLHNVFMLLTLEPHLARNPYLVLHVRRNHLVSDTLRELTMYSDVDLKKPLKVRATANHLQTSVVLFFFYLSDKTSSFVRCSGDLWWRRSRWCWWSNQGVLSAAAEGADGSSLWDVHSLQRLKPALVFRQSRWLWIMYLSWFIFNNSYLFCRVQHFDPSLKFTDCNVFKVMASHSLNLECRKRILFTSLDWS